MKPYWIVQRVFDTQTDGKRYSSYSAAKKARPKNGLWMTKKIR